jgi:F-type H+-transporting ATPase subunit b
MSKYLFYIVSTTEAASEAASDNAFFKITKDLGLTLDSFIFYLICFVITFAALSYFLFKPLLGLIINRQNQINDNIEKSIMLESELNKFNQDQSDLKESIYKEKSAIIEEARIEAKHQAETIINNANSKAKDIETQANKDALISIEQSKSLTQKEVIQFYSQLITKNMLTTKLDPNANQKAMDELLNQPIKF